MNFWHIGESASTRPRIKIGTVHGFKIENRDRNLFIPGAAPRLGCQFATTALFKAIDEILSRSHWGAYWARKSRY
jgi:hypothetical protein